MKELYDLDDFTIAYTYRINNWTTSVGYNSTTNDVHIQTFIQEMVINGMEQRPVKLKEQVLLFLATILLYRIIFSLRKNRMDTSDLEESFSGTSNKWC